MMFSPRVSAVAVLLFALLFAVCLLDCSEAAYRKPPFNGSIFGKRNSLEYENAKALTAMCEIALEACQSWFPASENK